MNDETVFCYQCREKHEAPECGEMPPPDQCKHFVPKRLACSKCINERAAVEKVQTKLAL